MRKRLRLALGILAITVLGCIAWVLLRPKEIEPVYESRTLRSWLGGYKTWIGLAGEVGTYELHPGENLIIDNSVRQVGTNAIPILLEMLAAKDSIPFKLGTFADDHGLHMFKPKSAAAGVQHVQAAMAFRALGYHGLDAVPQLTKLLNQVRDRRDNSLGMVASALGSLGRSASNAVPALLDALTNAPIWRFDYNLLSALGDIQAYPENVIPVLITALKTNDAGYRFAACDSLSKFGGKARQAVPALVTLLTNSNPSVGWAATNALRAIAPEKARSLGIP